MTVVHVASGYTAARLAALRDNQQILEEELRAVKAKLVEMTSTPDTVERRDQLKARQEALEAQIRAVTEKQSSWPAAKSA
jgi:chaperonin cofactor prefoldin